MANPPRCVAHGVAFDFGHLNVYFEIAGGAGSSESAEKGTRCESGAAPQRYVETNLALALDASGKRRAVGRPQSRSPRARRPAAAGRLAFRSDLGFRGEFRLLARAVAAPRGQPRLSRVVPVRPRGRR